jgi:hypothetical protein
MAAIAESPAVGTTQGGPYGGGAALSLTLRGVLVAVYAGLLLAGAASSMLAVFGRSTVAIPLLTVLFLLFGPGAAVGWLLPGFDPAVRLLTGLFAGVVLDCVVAESMLALRMWSVRGGIGMVLLGTAALLTVGAVARVRGGTPRTGT